MNNSKIVNLKKSLKNQKNKNRKVRECFKKSRARILKNIFIPISNTAKKRYTNFAYRGVKFEK